MFSIEDKNIAKTASMSLKIPYIRRILSIAIATTLAGIGFLLVIFKLDPFNETSVALILFFLSAGLALTGTFTLIMFVIKKWKSSHYTALKHVNVSLRQGVLISLCCIICAGLLMLGLLRIWNGILIVAFISLLEFYFSSKEDFE